MILIIYKAKKKYVCLVPKLNSFLIKYKIIKKIDILWYFIN